jgi:flagellar basal-body rod protein FlgB
MMMNLLRSMTSDVISKSLDGHYARQKAIVSNIANAETPGYNYRNVTFQDDLRRALEQARSGQTNVLQHMPLGETVRPLALQSYQPAHYGFPLVPSQRAVEAYTGEAALQQASVHDVTESDYHYRNDGNGVDLEREMVALSKNGGEFKSLITFQSRLNQQLKGVITNNG